MKQFVFAVFLLFSILHNADSAFTVNLHLQIKNDTGFKFSLANPALHKQCLEHKRWALVTEGLKSVGGGYEPQRVLPIERGTLNVKPASQSR